MFSIFNLILKERTLLSSLLPPPSVLDYKTIPSPTCEAHHHHYHSLHLLHSQPLTACEYHISHVLYVVSSASICRLLVSDMHVNETKCQITNNDTMFVIGCVCEFLTYTTAMKMQGERMQEESKLPAGKECCWEGFELERGCEKCPCFEPVNALTLILSNCLTTVYLCFLNTFHSFFQNHEQELHVQV